MFNVNVLNNVPKGYLELVVSILHNRGIYDSEYIIKNVAMLNIHYSRLNTTQLEEYR